MACRQGEAGAAEKLRTPARVAAGMVAVAAFVGSFWVPNAPAATAIAALTGLILFVVILLPVLTQFQIDALGIKATASMASRKQRIQEVCQQETRKLTSFAEMVSVDPSDVTGLVEEAVSDTCRLWRGKVVDELIRQLLICRAVRLIKIAAQWGVPYRLVTTDITGYGPTGAAFAALEPIQRLIVALVIYEELDRRAVAAMLDVDMHLVDDALRKVSSVSEMAEGSP